MSEESGSATEMERASDEESQAKVLELARTARMAMMATYDADGTAHARPMVAVEYVAPEDGAALWFFTRDGSRKVDELERDPRVLLTYSDSAQDAWVSIEGRALVVRDTALAKELWKEPLRTWFPEGPDDPELAMIKVVPEAAEYWDTPSGALVYAYGYLKAAITGKAPDPGEVKHVEM